MVICLDLVADLHMAQLMPLPLTVFCFSKIQIGFTFLVPAYPGSPGQTAVKRVCVRNETDDYQLLFIVSVSLLCKILNACQNKIHGIVAYTFLNIHEKIHQFSSSIKRCTQKNWFLFSASQCSMSIHSNPLWWISLGPDHEYPLRQSVHLSMFYICHYVKT